MLESTHLSNFMSGSVSPDHVIVAQLNCCLQPLSFMLLLGFQSSLTSASLFSNDPFFFFFLDLHYSSLVFNLEILFLLCFSLSHSSAPSGSQPQAGSSPTVTCVLDSDFLNNTHLELILPSSCWGCYIELKDRHKKKKKKTEALQDTTK